MNWRGSSRPWTSGTKWPRSSWRLCGSGPVLRFETAESGGERARMPVVSNLFGTVAVAARA